MRILLITIGAALALLVGWVWFLSPRSARAERAFPGAGQDEFADSGERGLGEPSTASVAFGRRSSPTLASAETQEDLRGPLLHGRVVNRSQVPLPKARVFVQHGLGVLTRTRTALITDAEGCFAWRGAAVARLRGERITLQVTHDEYAQATHERVLPRFDDEFELGDLIVENGGEVSGRVVDLAGHPVPGATVRLLASEEDRPGLARGHGESDAGVSTESDGSYRMRHAAAGGWRAVATASAHVQASSAAFLVENGARTEVADIELGPGFRLEGLVLDGSGRPVPTARVNLRPRRGISFQAATDALGQFTLEHLPGGPALLAVVAEGYLRTERSDFDPGATFAPVTLTLERGLTLAGVALDAERNGPVLRFAALATRLDDLPLRGKRAGGGDIEAKAASSGPAFGHDLGSFEDRPDGHFSWTGLREGLYRIELQSPDHLRWRSPAIELRADTAPQLVTALLERGLTLVGSVRDIHGRPVGDARVELRSAGRDPSALGLPLLDTRTDRAGGFVLAHVPKGMLRVVASAPGYASAGSAALDPLEATEALELTLGPLGTIVGVVRGLQANSRTSVTVVTLSAGPALSATLREDGSYRIENVPPGAHAVRATLGGVEGAWRRFGAELLAGTLDADLTVLGGETARFDPWLEPPESQGGAGRSASRATRE